MSIEIRINIDLTPRQKKIVRGAVVTGAVIAALGVGIAVAAPINTSWIVTGGALSATELAADLNGLQGQVTALQGTMTLDGGAPALVPPGTIEAYGGSVNGNPGDTGATNLPPNGWLLCNGDQILASTYPALYAAIGAGFGSTGAGVFNLPDLRGMFLRGLDTTAGATNDPNVGTRTAQNPGGNTGAEVGTYEADVFALHNHNYSDPGHVHQTTGVLYGAPGGLGLTGSFAESVGVTNQTAAAGTNITFNAQGGAETRPRNVAVIYLIKY